jgi:hypothetical protein
MHGQELLTESNKPHKIQLTRNEREKKYVWLKIGTAPGTEMRAEQNKCECKCGISSGCTCEHGGESKVGNLREMLTSQGPSNSEQKTPGAGGRSTNAPSSTMPCLTVLAMDLEETTGKYKRAEHFNKQSIPVPGGAVSPATPQLHEDKE